MTDKEKPCKFCKAMEVKREIVDIIREKQSPEELKRYGEYKIEYAVAILTRSWYSKNGKKHATRTTDYRHMGLGYKLNYCPECGIDMRGMQDDSV